MNDRAPVAGFRHLDFSADLAVEAWARTRGALFVQCVRALSGLMVAGTVREAKRVPFRAEGDDEELLHACLSEVIYRFEADAFVTGVARARLRGRRLSGALLGERYDERRHTLLHGVKAVTYHRLHVRREGGLWRARVVFDA